MSFQNNNKKNLILRKLVVTHSAMTTNEKVIMADFAKTFYGEKNFFLAENKRKKLIKKNKNTFKEWQMTINKSKNH